MQIFWLDLVKRWIGTTRTKLRTHLALPPDRSPLFVAGMGIISVVPLFAWVLIFVVNVPVEYLIWKVAASLLTFLISFMIFGKYATGNKALSNKVNYLFGFSFVFTLFTTMPLYWFIGILIPFIEKNQIRTKLKTGRVWTLLLSLAPVFSLLVSIIGVYVFSSDLWVGWLPLFVSLSVTFYFSYHALRYPIRTLNRELLWILSFFMTGTLSLPIYWFKRIYETTLFPSNVEVVKHELWIDDGNDHQHNLEVLGFENTADMELDFCSKESSEHSHIVEVQRKEGEKWD